MTLWPMFVFCLLALVFASLQSWRADYWMRRAKESLGHPERFGECQFCERVKELGIRICRDCEEPVRIELLKQKRPEI